LRQLIKALGARGVHLISTSVHELPTALRQFFSHQVLHTWVIPSFSHREASELLQSHGTPEPNLAQAKFLNTLSRQYPLLLAATAQCLSQHHWQLDDQTLTELSENRHASDLKGEVQQRLLASIPGAHDREMLYRLSAILSMFSLGEARTVAAVDPELDHPHERLIRLAGPWVDQDQHERYTLSPVLAT
jgi:hypothetical protein